MWEISFPIDHRKFVGLKKEFKLNESVVFAGQQLTFKNVTIYPTRVEVDDEFAEENTMKITNFEDLKIVNEKGESWTGTTGAIATHFSDNHWKLFLGSNYFHEGNELYLQATSIRALPKNEVEVVVDLQNKTIIKGPKSLVLD
ncbi:hypothetical protein H1D32_18170 [Anaerobacillus sp. CMMVII]|uniref:DUF5643 domain-containing protein n=1 Tax=Anaerobacillus sp. CMMVII TaxID=2755588 RepID=UPI0021B7424D|nr:DUF5643 domain-containing protein [Anaerobacillus sp. CMMVII]MCT8139460.1 hypothetical protein [Anaerobacillus sp. CMMVII]